MISIQIPTNFNMVSCRRVYSGLAINTESATVTLGVSFYLTNRILGTDVPTKHLRINSKHPAVHIMRE